MSSPLPVLLLLGVLVVAGVLYVGYHQRRKREEALAQLLRREPTLVITNQPCGLDARRLAAEFAGTPRGDRRYGIRYGVAGPHAATVGGHAAEVECAAFEWFWEVKRTHRDQHGTRTTYSEQRTVVAAVRLPTRVPVPVSLTPESLFGRVGLDRRDHQLESSEFNRRFRVRGGDRMLLVQLLDARMQELLTTEFDGRCVELTGDILLLAGRPSHRDPSLYGVVGELPAVRQDVTRLLGAVPAQFWRAVGVDG